MFAEGLGLPTIWVPHSYPGCSQHAPDEHILLPVTEEALAIMAGLFWDLGEIKKQSRHGRACPGHPRPSLLIVTENVDARHKAGHDGEF